MPRRGSARSLLPIVRPRAATRAGLGACAALVLLAGAAEFRDAFPTWDKDGIAQALHQSAWDKALSGQSAPDYWPLQDLTANMSLAPSAKVRRLGLSAAMHDPALETVPVARPAKAEITSDTNIASVAKVAIGAKAVIGPVEGDVALGDVDAGDVGIGDSITFTANDGATCIYHVTGRPVVDPHLASGEAQRAEAGLFECGPLESLLMRATQMQARPDSAQPAATDDQRKL